MLPRFIVFNRDMEQSKRITVLAELKKVVAEMKDISSMRRHILDLTLEYAEKKLIGWVTFNKSDADYYCVATFVYHAQNTKLGDAHFMHFVVENLEKFYSENDLAQTIYRPAKNYRDLIIRAMDKKAIEAAIGLASVGYMTGRFEFILVAVLIGVAIAAGGNLKKVKETLDTEINKNLLKEVKELKDGGDSIDRFITRASSLTSRLAQSGATVGIGLFDQTVQRLENAARMIAPEEKQALTAASIKTLQAPTSPK